MHVCTRVRRACAYIRAHTDKHRRQTQRHTDTQTHRHTDTPTHRHADTQTHRHTDTQTLRHSDTQTHTQTHRHTDTQTRSGVGLAPCWGSIRRWVIVASGSASEVTTLTKVASSVLGWPRRWVPSMVQSVDPGCQSLLGAYSKYRRLRDRGRDMYEHVIRDGWREWSGYREGRVPGRWEFRSE